MNERTEARGIVESLARKRQDVQMTKAKLKQFVYNMVMVTGLLVFVPLILAILAPVVITHLVIAPLLLLVLVGGLMAILAFFTNRILEFVLEELDAMRARIDDLEKKERNP